jgi:hypothetical protein
MVYGRSKSEVALIDISDDASNSTSVNVDNMLLAGIVFPSAMTGSNITFDFSVDGSYTVSAGNATRVDPSGWAFASGGYLRITSDGTEAADRKIKLIFRTA